MRVAGVDRCSSAQQQLSDFTRVALGRKMKWSPSLIIWCVWIHSGFQQLPNDCDIDIDSCAVKWCSPRPIDSRPLFSLWMFCSHVFLCRTASMHLPLHIPAGIFTLLYS
jgi:hypothetical protein